MHKETSKPGTLCWRGTLTPGHLKHPHSKVTIDGLLTTSPVTHLALPNLIQKPALEHRKRLVWRACFTNSLAVTEVRHFHKLQNSPPVVRPLTLPRNPDNHALVSGEGFKLFGFIPSVAAHSPFRMHRPGHSVSARNFCCMPSVSTKVTFLCHETVVVRGRPWLGVGSVCFCFKMHTPLPVRPIPQRAIRLIPVPERASRCAVRLLVCVCVCVFVSRSGGPLLCPRPRSRP